MQDLFKMLVLSKTMAKHFIIDQFFSFLSCCCFIEMATVIDIFYYRSITISIYSCFFPSFAPSFLSFPLFQLLTSFGTILRGTHLNCNYNLINKRQYFESKSCKGCVRVEKTKKI